MVTEKQLIARVIRMFKCDTAYIVKSCRKMFLVIGYRRESKGEWTNQLGEPQTFRYYERRCIASGWTRDAVLKSAKRYRELLKYSHHKP